MISTIENLKNLRHLVTNTSVLSILISVMIDLHGHNFACYGIFQRNTEKSRMISLPINYMVSARNIALASAAKAVLH